MSNYLKNAWFLGAWAKEVSVGKMLRRQLLDEYYVLFRDAAGTAKILVDRCPHRFAPLSKGQLLEGGDIIRCPYHGLEFNTEGSCTRNPHGNQRIHERAHVESLPLVEKFSALWVWMGDPARADESLIPDFGFLNPALFAVACDRLEIDANYQLETDNIMDLSHIEYLHPLFSSTAVSAGEYRCEVEDTAIWLKRFIANDDLPQFLKQAFGFAEDQLADRWLDVRWNAPASMALWSGAVEAGKSKEEGNEVVGAHVFTPATQEKTHYFFSSSMPLAMGAVAQQIADESLSAATGANGVFTTEDKPMLEAQAENMQGQDFWEMKPIVLNIDAGGVQARRRLEKLIKAEQHIAEPA